MTKAELSERGPSRISSVLSPATGFLICFPQTQSCLHVRGRRRMALAQSCIFITDFSKGSLTLFTCGQAPLCAEGQSLHVWWFKGKCFLPKDGLKPGSLFLKNHLKKQKQRPHEKLSGTNPDYKLSVLFISPLLPLGFSFHGGQEERGP